MNMDGAIGAILADPGMKQAGFNGIFMIARTPGLIAHATEERPAKDRCAASIQSIRATTGRPRDL
jgi:citrate synthase